MCETKNNVSKHHWSFRIAGLSAEFYMEVIIMTHQRSDTRDLHIIEPDIGDKWVLLK
jgi:hypothetical protein